MFCLEISCCFTTGSNSFPEAARSALQDCPDPGVVRTRGVTFPRTQQPGFAADAQHLVKSQLPSCSTQESPLLSPTQLRAGFWTSYCRAEPAAALGQLL